MNIARIIQLAIMAGVGAFAFIVGLVWVREGELLVDASAIELMDILTIVNLILTATLFPLALFISNRIFSPENQALAAGEQGEESIATRCVGIQRSGLVVRLAMMEGPAIFGLVVCLIATLDGVLQSNPQYWANLLGTAILLLYGGATLPSKERLLAWFERRFS